MSRKREDSSWERLYEERDVETLPWFYPGLDPDFAAAIERYHISSGEMLDLCTGPGTQAIAMAERGFKVTAMDIAGTAVKKACMMAKDEGLEIDFQQDNILDSRLMRAFDVIFDRGCFHVFPPNRRREYVPAVSRLIKHDGYLFLKCFSNLEKVREGPYRIAPDEIGSLFDPAFEILGIDHTYFKGKNLEESPKALFCTMRKR